MEIPHEIEIRPDVMLGKACLKGTRIPVYLVLEKLAAGETAEQMMDAYPQITRQHLAGTLQYASSRNVLACAGRESLWLAWMRSL